MPTDAPEPTSAAEPVARASEPPNTCPRCDRALELRHSDKLVVAACDRGHGLFMSHAVLREAKREGPIGVTALDRTPPPSGREASEPDESPACRCPRCGEPMDRRPFAPHTAEGETHAPVLVDVCAAHGTWFDAGELRGALASRSSTTNHALDKQANATLDVALALEQAREEETMRRAVDTADDLLDTFNFLVLGRGSRRRW